MTLFEKIIAREIPADIVYEDDYAVAFRDISPQAPVHLLIVPRKPIPRVGDATEDEADILGHLLLAAGKIAKQFECNEFEKGFRLVINHGQYAGEVVPHLHIHFLTGRDMTWPPG